MTYLFGELVDLSSASWKTDAAPVLEPSLLDLHALPENPLGPVNSYDTLSGWMGLLQFPRQKCCVRHIPAGWRNRPRAMEKNLSIFAGIRVIASKRDRTDPSPIAL